MKKTIFSTCIALLFAFASYGYSALVQASAFNATWSTYQYGQVEGQGTYTFQSISKFYNAGGELATPGFCQNALMNGRGHVYSYPFPSGSGYYWDSTGAGGSIYMAGEITLYTTGECTESNANVAYSRTTLTW